VRGAAEGLAGLAGAAVVADVGGTSARFALVDGAGGVGEPVVLESVRYRDLTAPLVEVFSRLAVRGEGARVAVAVAGPVVEDQVELTNVGWGFSIAATRRDLGLERLVAINDLEAVAWSLPALDPARIETLVGGGPAPAGRARVDGVVGVGTGLGVGGVHTSPRGAEAILATEGGHRDLAAASAREWAVVEALSARFGGHVSAERVISGPGLAALYEALGTIDGAGAVPVAPDEVAPRAAAGDARARETLRLFAGWLGAFAGDLALTLGARGGIWIAGGVVPALGPAFDRRAFVDRFLDKGRFRGWLEGVPVRLVLDPLCALRGAARALAAAGKR
jgi:glucokinase